MLDNENTSKEEGQISSRIDSSTKNNRRGFLRKVAIAAPLLTTVASRPVWAGQCSLSGNLSNNVSNQNNDEPCQYNTYSPGGWLNGRAAGSGSNIDLWQYTGFSRNDSLSTLLLGTDYQGSIASALGGGPHGWERQLACAALNAALWDYALNACTIDANCPIMEELAPNFYFPFTLEQIRTIYLAGEAQNIYDWESMQNID